MTVYEKTPVTSDENGQIMKEKGGSPMKKRVSMVTVGASVLRWLCEKMEKEHLNSVHSIEFYQGIQELLNQDVATLMVELDDSGESENFVPERICVKDLEIYVRNRKVLREGKEISLTPKEFDILYFLARNRGEVFTKEQIYQAVWEEDFLLADSNIMAFIRKLRKKIEPNPDAPEYIITIWGIGYKFRDDV